MKLLLLKGSFILLLILSANRNPLFCQIPEVDWQRSLGGSGVDYGFALDATSDDGVVIAGITNSTDGDVTFNHGLADSWVVKLDYAGNLIWQKSYGGSQDDGFNAIQQTSDHGFIMAGYSSSSDGDVSGNHGSYDFWVVKTDSLGNIIWTTCSGGSGEENATDVVQTSDDGYLVAGYSGSTDGEVTGNHGGLDFWIVKLNENGFKEWQVSFGGSSDEEAWDMNGLSDGNFIISGFSTSNDGDVSINHGSFDYWVVKMGEDGNLIWQKSLGGSGFDWSFGCTELPDQTIVVCGLSSSTDGDITGNHGNNDAWMAGLSSEGSLLWQKSLGGTNTDVAASLFSYNGGLIFGGDSQSSDGDVLSNFGVSDFWLGTTDLTGNLTSQMSLGGSAFESIAYHCLDETSLGTLYFGGTSASNDFMVTGNHGEEDFWIVRLGGIAENIYALEPEELIISPTITRNVIQVQTGDHRGTLFIYDMLGIEITSEKFSGQPTVSMDLSYLPGGIYSLCMRDENNKLFTGRVLKQ